MIIPFLSSKLGGSQDSVDILEDVAVASKFWGSPFGTENQTKTVMNSLLVMYFAVGIKHWCLPKHISSALANDLELSLDRLVMRCERLKTYHLLKLLQSTPHCTVHCQQYMH